MSDVCRHVCPICGGCDQCCLRPRHCQTCHDDYNFDCPADGYHQAQEQEQEVAR